MNQPHVCSLPALTPSFRSSWSASAGILAMVLALGQPVFGQAPTAPGVPGGSSAPDAGNYVPTGDGAVIKVNFPNSPIQAIIPFYTQLTGKKMILTSNLQGESLRIIGPKPMTKREAIQYIEATLLLNGYAVIPWDAETVTLIHHSGGENPSTLGLPVFNAINDLPEGDQVVHFVMSLNHISPEEASKAFQEVIKLHAYGAIKPVSNAASLIITENTATIRAIYNIAQVIDVPPAEISNELIKLERSDAERIAEIINDIYEAKEEEAAARSTSSGGQNVAAQPSVPGQPGTPGARPGVAMNGNGSASTADTNPAVAKVKVIPDRRQNSLLIIARPVDIAYIKGLVEKLDQQTDGGNFLERKLKFLSVEEFMPVAQNALARDTDIQSEGGDALSGGGGGSSRRPRGSSNTPSTDAARSSRQSGVDSQFGSTGSFGNGGFGGSGGGFGGSSASRSALDDPDQSASPMSVVVGRTLLIGDPISNSLIVSGSPEHIQIIDQLIERLDVRPQQIYISTIIGQLTLGGEVKYGFDFLGMLDGFSLQQNLTTDTRSSTGTDASQFNTDYGTGLPPTMTGSRTRERSSTFGSDTGLGESGEVRLPFSGQNFNWGAFNLYGQLGSLTKYVNLLENDRRFKVLSTPSVYTKNNTKATISSGQRIAVPTQILSNGSGIGGVASTSASIDYRDVVLKLEVIPLINSEDEVTLRIAQVNDNIIGEQIISGNTIPTLSTQELVTEVTVKNGSTVVLGGLITERDGDNGKGTIFLRRIPVIKHLFGTTNKTKSREELLIFLQPHIISSTDPLDKPNRIERGRSSILDDTVQFGVPRALPYQEQ
jgi:general secretion pathway protein D